MDETQIAVQRLKHGDIGGLETLIRHHQVRAVRTAFLILQDEAAAQDVVQETFLAAWRSASTFRGPGSARGAGSCFWLELPYDAAAKPEQSAAPVLSRGRERRPSRRPSRRLSLSLNFFSP